MYYNKFIITTLLISITKSLENSFKYYLLDSLGNLIKFLPVIKVFNGF